LAAVPAHQVDDLQAIAHRQAEVGYTSELITGNSACAEYLTWLWPDFDARGVEAVLHERRSGWADAAATVRELAREAREAGVRIVEQTEVIGLEKSGRSVSCVLTSRGRIRCDHVVFACGVWMRAVWRMLGGDFWVTVGGASTPLVDLVKAQEGDFAVPGVRLQAAAGHDAPVVHLDAAGPLRCDGGERTIIEGPWGVYFRMGRTGSGVTLGGLPERLGPDAPLDPYGPKNPCQVAGDSFREFAEAALAHF
ncbi:MAG: FAD-binding oxidoreductase, partial [Pseudonocardiales bacterium]|nr:FAD-binding oxidoreductase [Pseudonocardiales bacterium]